MKAKRTQIFNQVLSSSDVYPCTLVSPNIKGACHRDKEIKEGKIKKTIFHKPSVALRNEPLYGSLKGTCIVKDKCHGQFVIPLALYPFTCMHSPYIFLVPMNVYDLALDKYCGFQLFQGTSLGFHYDPSVCARRIPSCNYSIDRFRINLKLESSTKKYC